VPNQFKDFDEAASQADEISFKVAGKTYTVPPDPPMTVVLQYAKTDWENVTVTQVITFMSGCFGQATVDQMSADGVGFVTFCKIATWLLDVYGMTAGLNSPPEQADPKAQPPRRARRAKPTAATAKPKRPRGSASPRPRSSRSGS
jgi:hypothetical protein